MSKAKTNALDALRALIAERQQYEQWMTALDAKKEGTPEHVFERVQADYRSRLDRVVSDIRGHAEELQLSISTLSSRLVEVARDEDTRREGLQEAELRAAVGEYEPKHWDQLKAEAEQGLEKAAADRASLDAQLGELRAIQKLSEVGSVGSVPPASGVSSTAGAAVASEPSAQPVAHSSAATAAPAEQTRPTAPESSSQRPFVQSAQPSAAPTIPAPQPSHAAQPEQRSSGDGAQAEKPVPTPVEKPRPESEKVPLEPIAAAASAMSATQRPRSGKTPAGGMSAVRKTEAVKPDHSKTLKCPECGTPNYPTEWYCERCGGELATM